MAKKDQVTIEILPVPGHPDNGIVVEGEDCFPGDVVACPTGVGRYLVARGRAKLVEDAEPEAPAPATFVRRGKAAT